MTDLPPPKENPDQLALRGRPRPVTRLSRRALAILATVSCVSIAVAVWYALDAGSLFHRDRGEELFNTENKPQADGLSGLPRSYADLPKPKSVPPLGPPMPGDIGRAPPTANALPPEPDRLAQAEDQRRMQEAEAAATGKVFFQVNAKVAGASGSELSGVAQIGNGDRPAAGSPGELDADADQNLQDHKQAFLARRVATDTMSPYRLQGLRSPYQLMAGTIISAALLTGLNSDLPGEIIGQVTDDVYDTATGRSLLIPQGAKLIGKYDSIVAYGQERALLIWTRLILPDGSSIILDNLPGTDTAGYAGLEDGVDYHTWRLIKGIALSTLLGVSSELAANNGTDSGNRITVGIRDSADNSANQAGQRIVTKDLSIQPTLTVRPGFPLRVIVNRDIVLKPYAR
ncbi:MAG TPA: TrbI/VirB10 family protein [Alphaproteobacteria bacterium]|nr:TrbI/VirB10 family protein [Alphaproteobacteria bacterium]